LLWKLTKTLAFWVLLVWGIATGVVMLGFWIAAECGCMPQFDFFRGWGILYCASFIAPLAITLAHFDWWSDGKVGIRGDEKEKEEPEDTDGATTSAPQGGGS
jgi:hypothetical protein